MILRSSIVPVRVYCVTSYGETVHIVGNCSALGNWMPTEQNKLTWSELNWWENKILNLPQLVLEYKFVIKDQSGGLRWESGENRFLVNRGNTTITEAFDRPMKSYIYQHSLEIKVMSFNIRYDTPVDGPNQWIHRRDIVSQIVTGCDVFGLQEPLHHQLTYIKDRLGDAFNYVSWGRDDGQDRGEASPIFYRADLFQQEDCGVFWLSETPNTPGSRAWGAPLPRICSWVKLRSKTKPAPPFFVFNTHLDYESSKARKLGLYLILSKMRAITYGLPCILMGDFNSVPSEGLIAEVATESCATKWGISLVNAGAGSKQATFTGFENLGAHGMLIDYVLVSKGVRVVDYKVLENGVPGRPASDHCPVVVTLFIENSSS